MKIIGFVASPRKSGNSAWIVNQILEGAKEQGAQTQVFSFNELDIKPCQSCYACKQGDRKCIIKDDMQKLYAALEDADALVLGAPIYMGQMSAQAKIFTDRLYATASPKFSPHYKERAKKMKLILAFSQGNPDTKFFQPYYDYTKKVYETLEFDVKDLVIVTDMRSGAAADRKDLHTTIKDIGTALAKE